LRPVLPHSFEDPSVDPRFCFLRPPTFAVRRRAKDRADANAQLSIPLTQPLSQGGEKEHEANEESPAYFFSMFQKTGTGDSSMPLMFLRVATGAYHCPR
jgi:hypothetical protein